jgi:hypothetical protein
MLVLTLPACIQHFSRRVGKNKKVWYNIHMKAQAKRNKALATIATTWLPRLFFAFSILVQVFAALALSLSFRADYSIGDKRFAILGALLMVLFFLAPVIGAHLICLNQFNEQESAKNKYDSLANRVLLVSSVVLAAAYIVFIAVNH